ncbi:MAG TPA: methylenetetrahydrofolate--tRNA-(uracil(54)-C(5))-methyltransferase (FADH(2)-oxidizing) TrmFO [Cyanobacteria bacterium UBA11149]|nr:methylenetetrahydrofolate--tRNA-(uracil(54)-C(5))-methyltransferase (FADH(2)-oxidizing) TrmFO [Cyanobacteria bacterium UBA11367]HBE60973.1 methylenetetrahydrofolate--tRNA-(uracil(54)-C(5))-methyltransferase (FADH(2)-oxidizing) TrmFO [Cyanobacteria bacterium UBA11366]HBR77151.1 methylenetetrahydrofolate--tRNA-(uracil(54)-C(5))-methyltransferase (FADH(2)-oxidizing) TrmFO [Cyanobacteria bacterium UBA11159]HBS71385.1 methylenetetrahydrofolate--tRNA-(uracil(54)-C(5))-methyltransferase (FADH(2)-oxi
MIHVIGGGLAGTEAAWQIARAGVRVILHEMRPVRMSPAHHTGELAELVCSNSFGAQACDRASGLLHEELRRLGSIIIATADRHAVPAGGALAVDRGVFSHELTEILSSHPLIELRREDVPQIPTEEVVVLTSGPLTSPALAEDLQRFTGMDYFSFFDAASPIVVGESINRDLAFMASRYDKGEPSYLNCPMNREQYLHFWQELCQAEKAELKDFEQETAKFFEGCLPIEEMARRGEDTMRYGPLKPVGLSDPRIKDIKAEENFTQLSDIEETKIPKSEERKSYRHHRPYAVVQLRQEDKAGELWNMVGFQTNLRWGEQKRVFRLIPGLENAEFVRMGVMHRNTFINAPQLLYPTLQFKKRHNLLAAGQLVGTEGYTAASAGGWLAGTNAARLVLGLEPVTLPGTTMMGALFEFISSASPKHFQPMPPNFGILPELGVRIKNKQERYGMYRDRALASLEAWRIGQSH